LAAPSEPSTRIDPIAPSVRKTPTPTPSPKPTSISVPTTAPTIKKPAVEGKKQASGSAIVPPTVKHKTVQKFDAATWENQTLQDILKVTLSVSGFIHVEELSSLYYFVERCSRV
jgi:hypothetical protein